MEIITEAKSQVENQKMKVKQSCNNIQYICVFLLKLQKLRVAKKFEMHKKFKKYNILLLFKIGYGKSAKGIIRTSCNLNMKWILFCYYEKY